MEYYAIFCLSVLFCIVYIQLDVLKKLGIHRPFKVATIFWLITTFIVTLLAPLFFTIILFAKGSYEANISDLFTQIYL